MSTLRSETKKRRRICSKNRFNRAEHRVGAALMGEWGVGRRMRAKKRPPGEGRPERTRTIRRTRTISLPILFAGEGVDDFEVFDVVVEVGAEG